MARKARRASARRSGYGRSASRGRSSGYRATRARSAPRGRRRTGGGARTVRIELVTAPANPVARPERMVVEDKGVGSKSRF